MQSLCEKCPVFSRIQTRKNSIFGHFSHNNIYKKENSYEVFIITADTDQTHPLTSAPDLIIQFDPTNVLISASAVYNILSINLHFIR